MSAENEFRCPHIETCPNVLQACERKVKAEGAMEVFKAKAKEYEEKRPLMNALYSAGLAMRKAQKKYFSERSKEALICKSGGRETL